MRHPAQVEHHEDDLPLGQDQEQEAGYAGRHKSRIFRCSIICPDHIVFADGARAIAKVKSNLKHSYIGED